MNISGIPTRLAVTGLAAALAAGAMVAGTTATAEAAGTNQLAGLGGGTTYSCEVPLLGPVDLPLVADIPDLPTELPTELPLAGLPVNVTSVLPSSLLGPLGFLGLTDIGGSIGGFTMILGGLPLPVDGLSALPVGIPSLGDLPLAAAGLSSPTTQKAGAPGVYDLALPTSFDFLPLSSLPLPIPVPELGLPCTIKDPATAVVGSVRVRKQTAALAAAVTRNPVPRHKAPKVAVNVARELGGKGAGTVVARMDGRKVGSTTLNNGSAIMKLAKMKPGKHKVTLTYLGNARTAKSSKNVVVRVAK